ncbi:MAG: 3-hydroxyacyl-CoA dehydrogenase NAD-binding domain-containing protein [Acidobacteriota bacterium]|nr:3-hydroxyacyl-CoA dehydrogenase NAD-binding domain-containing protein [Acidobacteriota bacterium]
MQICRIAVIGAGVAGRDFAIACAQAGLDVVLEDVMPAKLRQAEAVYADLTVGGGMGSLKLALTVEDAVREADIAVDFVPDELESKLEIFSLIDRMASPKTILCTPTNVLSITDLASCVYRPERCVALRGVLVSGGKVRLIHPAGVSKDVLASVQEFLEALGIDVLPEVDVDAPMLVKHEPGQ